MASENYLFHILPANRWGGIERYTLDICRHFNSEGWKVAAITRDAKAVDDLFTKAGVPLLHAPFGSMLDFQSIGLLIKELKKCSHKGRVIVHTHGSQTAFTALLARKLSGNPDVKVVMTRHKVKPANDSLLFRKIYSSLDAMIFVSQLARDRFLSVWKDRPLPFHTDRFHVIHNSINLPAEEPPATVRHKGPLTAMFHGPVIPGKGLETLLDAMALLKGSRIRLKIMGGGPPDYADRLRRRALSRGVMDSIDWHRHSDDPFGMIREVDFGVLPAVNEEAFGLANIEYMACAKPQICSSNGAQPEYITDGREGFLLSPGDPVSLAKAMRDLASYPDLREEMGRNARDTFNSRLSWPNFISHLSSIYDSRD